MNDRTTGSPRGRIDRRRVLQAVAAGGLASVPWALAGCATAAGEPPVAKTQAGAVRGSRQGDAFVFKGIPYGASTAGAGRFAAPRPPVAWTDIRDATALGPRAPGLGYPPFLMREEGADLDTTAVSEDCLVLNVWTGGLAASDKRPVMVWLHGGGFNSGSGGSVRYDGSRLAARRGVVVVTVNHRVGALGFLYLAGLGGSAANRFPDAGNAGMLDIVQALQWVRDNIGAFGGDAGNVTIFGESGGGFKVSTLMAMPAARGLFHRAIVESGAALRVATPEAATQMTQAVLAKLAVDPANLDALLSLPFDKITAATPGNIGPVVDGRTLPRQPFDPDAPPASGQIPLLIGSNLTELTFFNDTPLDPVDDAKLAALVAGYTRLPPAKADPLIALYKKNRPGAENHLIYQLISSDWWMTASVHLQAQRKSAQPAPVYVYQFAMRQGARGGKLNVPHTAEIAYVFDNLQLSSGLVGEATSAQQALADRVSDAWAAFARSGNPNVPGLPRWQPYSRASPFVMVLDAQPHPAAPMLSEEQAAVNALKPA